MALKTEDLVLWCVVFAVVFFSGCIESPSPPADDKDRKVIDGNISEKLPPPVGNVGEENVNRTRNATSEVINETGTGEGTGGGTGTGTTGTGTTGTGTGTTGTGTTGTGTGTTGTGTTGTGTGTTGTGTTGTGTGTTGTGNMTSTNTTGAGNTTGTRNITYNGIEIPLPPMPPGWEE